MTQSPASACPVHTGSPSSPDAAAFDMFTGAYQLDPAEALRWSRDQEPVFFSPKLGYWVVSRFDHVKAVFRDNITFSPAIALEKMTPTCPEANAILASYDYAINRTLVNEDEPAHMERRRALMHSFTPEELAHHEPMVRRLARTYVDRIIDAGRADLVDEMLWEVPLTVALHFLGVPEEDMDTLREYSIAHTVNTWGRPSEQEQLKVAEAVGKFWQFAGRVLDKMRADPDGHGWMQYAIRKQRDLPDVVTDSYLHSMMMAGIVAAHETTAHATANAMRLLLENREAWDAICADPLLIPSAVEEALRMSGSVVAWRRIVTADTRIGEVDIPAGAKLLIVQASANHDERHFVDGDTFDIYRDNTTDHLTFGYGSHQCMGKNLARMEMRIFVEAFAARLPHMRLAPQSFTYLANTSFRGPDHLHVVWDPALNPERRDQTLRDRRTPFPIGAPSSSGLVRKLRVTELRREAEDVVCLSLEDEAGRDMPAWQPGAHIELLIGDFIRKYSLCGDARDRQRLQIAVLREPEGRGGSAHIHEAVTTGMTVAVRGPKNHFRLEETESRYLLVAGGIGITPIIAMADRLRALGRDYAIHYAGRSRGRMAFVERLKRDHGDRLSLYTGDGARMDLPSLIGAAPTDTAVYACGPERLLAMLEGLMRERPGRLHVEHFSAGVSDHLHNAAFDVDLKDSGLSVHVPADRTLLDALRAAGIDVPSDCEEGLCGTCEVHVLSGDIEHRDKILGQAERAANTRIMSCCSRARGKRLQLAI
jgi:cytochrome P450/ferredoxin-NADP reductase